jgi:hypothetical protein
VNEPYSIIICGKQRNGEWEDKIGLYFDKSGLRFNESFNQAYPNFSSLRADLQS